MNMSSFICHASVEVHREGFLECELLELYCLETHGPRWPWDTHGRNRAALWYWITRFVHTCAKNGKDAFLGDLIHLIVSSPEFSRDDEESYVLREEFLTETRILECLIAHQKYHPVARLFDAWTNSHAVQSQILLRSLQDLPVVTPSETDSQTSRVRRRRGRRGDRSSDSERPVDTSRLPAVVRPLTVDTSILRLNYQTADLLYEKRILRLAPPSWLYGRIGPDVALDTSIPSFVDEILVAWVCEPDVRPMVARWLERVNRLRHSVSDFIRTTLRSPRVYDELCALFGIEDEDSSSSDLSHENRLGLRIPPPIETNEMIVDSEPDSDSEQHYPLIDDPVPIRPPPMIEVFDFDEAIPWDQFVLYPYVACRLLLRNIGTYFDETEYRKLFLRMKWKRFYWGLFVRQALPLALEFIRKEEQVIWGSSWERKKQVAVLKFLYDLTKILLLYACRHNLKKTIEEVKSELRTVVEKLRDPDARPTSDCYAHLKSLAGTASQTQGGSQRNRGKRGKGKKSSSTKKNEDQKHRARLKHLDDSISSFLAIIRQYFPMMHNEVATSDQRRVFEFLARLDMTLRPPQNRTPAIPAVKDDDLLRQSEGHYRQEQVERLVGQLKMTIRIAHPSVRLLLQTHVWKYWRVIFEFILLNRDFESDVRRNLAVEWMDDVRLRVFGEHVWQKVVDAFVANYDSVLVDCALTLFRRCPKPLFQKFVNLNSLGYVLEVLTDHIDDPSAFALLHYAVSTNPEILTSHHCRLLMRRLGRPEGHAEDILYEGRNSVSQARLWKELDVHLQSRPTQKLLEFARMFVQLRERLESGEMERVRLLLGHAYQQKLMGLIEAIHSRLDLDAPSSTDVVRASIGELMIKESEVRGDRLVDGVLAWVVPLLELFPRILCPFVREVLPRSTAEYVVIHLHDLPTGVVECLAAPWSNVISRDIFFMTCGTWILKCYVLDQQQKSTLEKVVLSMLGVEHLYFAFEGLFFELGMYEFVLEAHKIDLLKLILRHVDHDFQLFKRYFERYDVELRDYAREICLFLEKDGSRRRWSDLLLNDPVFRRQMFADRKALRDMASVVRCLLVSDRAGVDRVVRFLRDGNMKEFFRHEFATELLVSPSADKGSLSMSELKSAIDDRERLDQKASWVNSPVRSKRKNKPKRKHKTKRKLQRGGGGSSATPTPAPPAPVPDNKPDETAPAPNDSPSEERPASESLTDPVFPEEQVFTVVELARSTYESIFPDDEVTTARPTAHVAVQPPAVSQPPPVVRGAGRRRGHPKPRHSGGSHRESVAKEVSSASSVAMTQQQVMPKDDIVEHVVGSWSEYQNRLLVVRFLRDFFHASKAGCFLYGSVAVGTFTRGLSDIDLLIVLKQGSPLLGQGPAIDVIAERFRSDERISKVRVINGRIPLIKLFCDGFQVDLSLHGSANGVVACSFFTVVDQTIGHYHLFKRAILLIRHWAREVKILSSVQNFLSTYALNVLVLNLLTQMDSPVPLDGSEGPLELLRRFVMYYAAFQFEVRDLVVACRDGVLLETDLVHFREWREKFIPDFGASHHRRSCVLIVDPLQESNNLGKQVNEESLGVIKRKLQGAAAEGGLEEFLTKVRKQERFDMLVLEDVHDSCKKSTLEELLQTTHQMA